MIKAILFDFYGTLARAAQWVSMDDILAEHGYDLPNEIRSRWWNQGIDGVEHVEHSQSRGHYVAWQRQRLLAMLAETDVHPGEYEIIVEKLEQGTEARVLEAYDEAHDVLVTLRARDLRLAVCSNWDWDLSEAIDEVGLTEHFDVIVSSAWAGARKPHPRIFEHTVAKTGVEPAATLFVGDTWGPDVTGPRSVGMHPLYLQRGDHWPDDTAPADPARESAVASDLRGIFDLV